MIKTGQSVVQQLNSKYPDYWSDPGIEVKMFEKQQKLMQTENNDDDE